jgi:hypothetical protein
MAFLDDNEIGEIPAIDFTEVDGVTYLEPSTPASGQLKLFPKDDHLLYIKDSTGTVTVLDTGTSGAPSDATYITQTPNGTLTNEQALSALATGILKSTTATGVLSIATAADLPSVLTTKGDVSTFSTVPARLAVGANNTVFVADSAATTGNKWTSALTGLTIDNSVIGGTTAAAATVTTLSAGTTATATPGNFYRDVNAGDSTNSVSVAIGNSGASQGYLLATYTNAAAAGAPSAGLSFQPRNNAGSALGVVLAGLTFTKTAAADTATASLLSTSGTLLLNASGQLVYTAAAIATAAIISGSNAGTVVTQFKNTQAVSASNTTGFNGSVNSTTQARTAWQIDGGLSDTTDATRTATVTLTTCASGSFATTATWVGRNFTNNGSITATLSDAVTAAVTNVVTIGHDSSGTPAANYGTGASIQGKSSTTAGQSMGDIQWIWTTATHASRKARGTLTAYDTAVRTCIQWEASGTAPMIGFLGTAPVVQATAWTQTYTTSSHTTANPTATSVVTTGAALASYGYTQAQADDIVTELNRLITDMANVKNNINAIIDDQQAYGLFG